MDYAPDARFITVGSAPSHICSPSAEGATGLFESGVNWYAVYTKPRHEKSVGLQCGFRGIECFCPVYQQHRCWNDGSRVVLDLPLFPNYVFVQVHPAARARVLSVPGVLAIVSGTDRRMATIPDKEIEILRRGLASCPATPHPLLTTGQRVLISSGAFAGITGIVVRTKRSPTKALSRVVLTLDSIMKSIAIELNGDDLEAVL